MIEISGFEIKGVIQQDKQAQLYRASRTSDGLTFMLKVINRHSSNSQAIAQFKEEYEIIEHLSDEIRIKAKGFRQLHNGWMMLLEDCGGVPLSQLFKDQGIGLSEFFPISIGIIESLDKIHKKRIIHKSLCPENILYNQENKQINIINFSNASTLEHETPIFMNPTELQGKYAYMAPEQTGRMNRIVDYRSDYYSLGVCLYELLTGRVPFSAPDLLGLVHCHIAVNPAAPDELNKQVPKVLSSIILKLLAKDAEERYQSSSGLLNDIKNCQTQWTSKGSIEPFELGKHDFPTQFHIPQKLYGRQTEIDIILDSFEEVSQGTSKVLLVKGHPGIGKTTLIQELYKPITKRKGYFISGKFDQLQRNVPYASLIQAFKSLVRQMLTEGKQSIKNWKSLLMHALGPNGRVIIEVIPELEKIIGIQPEIPQLSPKETQNRFNFVFENFVRTFAQKNHPLVIFLDDLQWSDAASLKLIEQIIESSDTKYLFLIGSYRDNEVLETSPLMLTIRQLKEAGAFIETLELNPLNFDSVNQLIADTIYSSPASTRELAEIVFKKTGGNPFFLTEFLKELFSNGHIRFDPFHVSWNWKKEKLNELKVSDNVVDLMIGKVKKLPLETQAVLKLLACIGNQCDIRMLAMINKKSVCQTSQALWPALQEGYIIPLSEDYIWAKLEMEDLSDDINVSFKFAHDRIQQAVYSLILDNQKEGMHWNIGEILLNNISEQDLEKNIFLIVNQLNYGVHKIADKSKKEKVAQLNLLAGKKAKTSIAYKTAYEYLMKGLTLLEENKWSTCYQLCYELNIEFAEISYLCGRHQQTKILSEEILNNATEVKNKIRAYEIQIQSLQNQGKQLEALKVARDPLSILGFHLPKKTTNLHVLKKILASRVMLFGKKPEDILKMQRQKSYQKEATLKILSIISSSAYESDFKLFGFIAIVQFMLAVQHGNKEQIAFSCAAYALLLSGFFGKYQEAYKLAKFAEAILDSLSMNPQEARTRYVIYGFNIHWTHSIKDTLVGLQLVFRIGLENGDHEYAGYSGAITYPLYSVIAGKNLIKIKQEINNVNSLFKKLKFETGLKYISIVEQIALNLTDANIDNKSSTDPSCDEDSILISIKKSNDYSTLALYYYVKLVVTYSFEDFQSSFHYSAEVKKILIYLAAQALVPEVYFFESLTCIKLLKNNLSSEKNKLLRIIRRNQRKLKKWATNAPMNYLHKFVLVKAEKAALLGKTDKAKKLYIQAISLAEENEFVNDAGLASKLFGTYCIANGEMGLAKIFLNMAYKYFYQWDAKALCKALENKYPDISFEYKDENQQEGSKNSLTLDFPTLIKASQAISEEIELDHLIKKLIHFVLVHSGAERACLILKQNEELFLEAEGSSNSKLSAPTAIPLSEAKDKNGLLVVCPEIIEYVTRSHEDLVIDNATQNGPFTHTEYVLAKRPKSILCTPLINQGKLLGVLYLENNLTTQAFSGELIKIIQLLGTQASISIAKSQAIEASFEREKLRLEQERLKMNNQLLEMRSKELKIINEEKDRFFSVISHDLRGPFNPIIGYSKLLREQCESMKKSQIKEFSEDIYSASVNVLSLLDTLLEWSRLQAGRIIFNPQEISLLEVISRSCSLLIEMAKQKKIKFINKIDSSHKVWADENMLNTIIRNLVSNAIKFTPVEGRITLSSYQRNDFTEIWVEDNGIGMNEEAQRKILEKDHFSTQGTQGESGAGLGLKIVKDFIEQHKGEFWVESTLGIGTIFKFKIPNKLKQSLH